MKNLDLSAFKQQLKNLKENGHSLDKKVEEKYLELFSSTVFTVEKAKAFIKGQEKELLENNLILHRNFEDTSSKIAKAYELSYDKNKKQIELYQKQAEKTIKDANKEFNRVRINTNKTLESENKILNEKLSELQVEFDADVLELHQEINALKNEAVTNSKRLEEDFTNKKNVAEHQYDETVTSINHQINILKDEAIIKINQFKDALTNETKSKDLSYLTIRKTHNTSSETLNTFINEIKANHQSKVSKLNSSYHIKINDLKIEIEDLRDYHENAKEVILEQHNEKLNALNIVFDVQKTSHNNKNIEIITNYNDNITKINSDLSATKNNINQKITNLEAEKISLMKNSNDLIEKERIKKSYNKEINKLNQTLLNYIDNASEKIMTEDIVFQNNLLNHDIQNVKHLNEWRFIKSVYDKEREIDYQIAVSKIENDLFILTEREKLTNKTHEIQMEILNLELEKELLPIESQLHLASLLSNRDINLLNVEYDSYKLNNELEIATIQKELQIATSKLDLELQLAKAEYQYQNKITALTHQLNIEKNILERNHKTEILNLRIALEEHLLDLKTTKLNNDFDNLKKSETLILDKEKVNLNYLAATLRKDSFIEQNKRLKIIDEIKNKNQRTLTTLRNMRNINISKNEAQMHEKINIYYMDYVLALFNNQLTSFNLLFETIQKPINPQITRNLISLLIEYNKHLLHDFYAAIDDYLNYNRYHFNLIITNFTKTKYQSKHEVILNDYNDSIAIISQSRKVINDKINNLIKDNKILDLERSSLELKLESHKNSKDKKEITALKKEITNINSSTLNNNKLIKNLFNQRRPLEKNLSVRKQIKEREEAKLEANKKYEETKYTQTIKRYENNFKFIKQNVTTFVNDLNNNYLQIKTNPYLNDQLFMQLYKKTTKLFTKNNNFIIKKFTDILDFWLKNYIHTKNENETIINTFNLSTERSLYKLKRNFEKFIAYEQKEKVELLNINKNKIARITHDINDLNQQKNQTKKSNNELYNIKYDETNKQITILTNKHHNKLKLINENLHYANNEYKRNLSRDLSNLKLTFKKEQTNLLADLILTKKEIKDNLTRTNERANVIITKYDSERSKHLKLMQQKRNRLQSKINKDEITITKETNLLEKKVNKSINENKIVINNYNIDLKLFRRTANKNKLRSIRKESKDLRKNYRFKKKAIFQTQK